MSRTSTLTEKGDLYAEPGSRPWALGLRMELWRLLDSADTDHDGLNRFLDTMVEFEGWRKLESSHSKPYRDFQEFCLDKRPHGLGVTRDRVVKWCERFSWATTSQAVANDPEVKPLEEHKRPDKGYDITFSTQDGKRGTAAEYLVRRLKRDHPDLAEKLARGEFKSARAAAIAAGIVKPPPPLEVARKAFLKLDHEDRTRFVAWIDEQGW